MSRGILLVVAIGATLAPAAAPAQEAPVAFRDVAVLSMTSDSVEPGRTVIVEDGRIAWVGPAGKARIPESAVVVEGDGRVLMPGLADLHVHAGSADMPLFLANGVTTIREMNGTPGHLALGDSIDAGLALGPRMVVVSPLLAGEEQPWRHELVPDAETAYRLAHEADELGYRALKVYDGLSREAYRALAEASETLSIPLVGHVPEAVGLEGVFEAGQRTIEHVEQIVYATVGHDPDPARIPGIAARVAESGTWVVPTLAAQKMISLRGTAAYDARMNAPEVRYVPKNLQGWWGSLRKPADAPDPGPDDPRRRRAEAFYAFQRDLTAALHEAGVPLLAGTDTPNPLLVPGFSIHDELAALVDAGLAPIEALKAATADGARFLGEEGEWGVVAPGAAADLVLVEANPLEDLGTLERPAGVLVRGRWLDRAALDRMLAEGGTD